MTQEGSGGPRARSAMFDGLGGVLAWLVIVAAVSGVSGVVVRRIGLDSWQSRYEVLVRQQLTSMSCALGAAVVVAAVWVTSRRRRPEPSARNVALCGFVSLCAAWVVIMFLEGGVFGDATLMLVLVAPACMALLVVTLVARIAGQRQHLDVWVGLAGTVVAVACIALLDPLAYEAFRSWDADQPGGDVRVPPVESSR